MEGLGQHPKAVELMKRRSGVSVQAGGHEQDRRGHARKPYILGQIHARDEGHMDIEHEEVIRVRPKPGEGHPSILAEDHLETSARENFPQQPADGGVVVRDQHALLRNLQERRPPL